MAAPPPAPPADDALLARAEQLTLVQDAMGIVTWIWDVQGTPVWHGDLSPLLGLPRGGHVHDLPHWIERLHPDDRGPSRERFVACVKGWLPSYRAEERVLWPDGSWHWLETLGRGSYGPDGRATRLVGVVTDITERKRAEQALLATEARFRRLIEDAPVAIGISRDDRILYGNPALLRLFGHESLSELVGVRVSDLIAPELRGAFLERTARRARGQSAPGSYEIPALRGDGGRFTCQVLVTEVALEDGPATLVYLQDVSERVHMLEQVQQLNASLEQRVAERTRELAEARDASEAATRAKSEFLANMSHEIRTPMNAILGMTALALRDATLAPQVRSYLGHTRHAAESLLGIVNDILDFSKIEAGKLELEHRAFTIDELLQRLDAMTGLAAADKGLRLVFDTAGDVPRTLLGDALRLGQVLLNLCSNAVKFTERGEIVVRTRCAAPPRADGVRLRFEVEDTGIGIDAAQRERLFTPFGQLDASSTRRFGGTGLGLAISRQLVGMMGGQIGVDSTPGLGSRFWLEIDFALATPADAQAARPGAGVVGAADPAGQLAGRRLLLVEDNELNRIVASDLLEGVAGAVVEVAVNGRDALDKLAQQPYELVLMDVQMPEMDGYAATRALREMPALAGLPVVAMTAHAMASDRASCLAAGMNDFVSKPFEPRELFATIARWLPPRDDLRAAPPSAVAALPEPQPEGISFERGLHLCMGRHELYGRVLQRYLDSRSGDPEALRAAIAAGDLRSAAIVAHTVVAAAGTIGAAPLSATARELHEALDRGEPARWPALLDRFERQHRQVLHQGQQHLAGGAA